MRKKTVAVKWSLFYANWYQPPWTAPKICPHYRTLRKFGYPENAALQGGINVLKHGWFTVYDREVLFQHSIIKQLLLKYKPKETVKYTLMNL